MADQSNATTYPQRNCTKCGRQIQVGFMVCDHCGTQQERSQTTAGKLPGVEIDYGVSSGETMTDDIPDNLPDAIAEIKRLRADIDSLEKAREWDRVERNERE